MSTSIIIGLGEVGRAFQQVLQKAHNTVGYDTKRGDPYPSVSEEDLKVLHICIPYDEHFEQAVKDYQDTFKPSYTIVHSTTPVGTCKALDVYHSPVRGVHPYLADSLTAFVTYLAPKNAELKKYLQQAGMDVRLVADTDTTEAGKLWSLAAYATSIILEKEMYKWCEQTGVDYAVAYKHFTHTYNNGYTGLGMENYVRPVLEHMDGKIGGHCIIPGMQKLAGTSKFIRSMLFFNED